MNKSQIERLYKTIQNDKPLRNSIYQDVLNIYKRKYCKKDLPLHKRDGLCHCFCTSLEKSYNIKFDYEDVSKIFKEFKDNIPSYDTITNNCNGIESWAGYYWALDDTTSRIEFMKKLIKDSSRYV